MMIDEYHQLEKIYGNDPSKSFVRAKTWAQTYVCDMLEHLVQEKNVKMTPVTIEGNWREIDTVQDKHLADAKFKW